MKTILCQDPYWQFVSKSFRESSVKVTERNIVSKAYSATTRYLESLGFVLYPSDEAVLERLGRMDV